MKTWNCFSLSKLLPSDCFSFGWSAFMAALNTKSFLHSWVSPREHGRIVAKPEPFVYHRRKPTSQSWLSSASHLPLYHALYVKDGCHLSPSNSKALCIDVFTPVSISLHQCVYTISPISIHYPDNPACPLTISLFSPSYSKK